MDQKTARRYWILTKKTVNNLIYIYIIYTHTVINTVIVIILGQLGLFNREVFGHEIFN